MMDSVKIFCFLTGCTEEKLFNYKEKKKEKRKSYKNNQLFKLHSANIEHVVT